MTIDTALSRRIAASLATALVLTVGSGVAHAATPLDREVRAALDAGPLGGQVSGPNQISWAREGVTMTIAAGKSEPVNFRRCPRLHVCLWQDRDATGRRIEFKEYGTYKLSRWSMTGRRGATSYYNHQCCGARATLIGPNFRLSLWTWGNIPRSMNDRGTYLKLFR
jgi:hypothetical protein